MLWLIAIPCLLGLVVLFFPFVFRITFNANFGKAEAHVYFFKKKLASFEKVWKKSVKEQENADSDIDDSCMPEYVPPKPKAKVQDAAPEFVQVSANKSNTCSPSKENCAPKENVKAAPCEPPVEKGSSSPESVAQAPGTHESKFTSVEKNPEEASSSKISETVSKTEQKQKTPVETLSEKKKEKAKPEKRSLTDTEFWTILLTPEFDSRAFGSFKKLLRGILKLFRVKFCGCFVEGFRMRYDHMGYAAAVNAFIKTYPYFGQWDFRMDWTHDHEPRSAGEIRISVNLCRIFGLLLLLLFHGGVLGCSFWLRRRHVLKTNELPELGFIRTKIVSWIVES